MLLDSKQFPIKKSLVCGLPTEKQVKPSVLSDWSSPVLPVWSAPAMGDPDPPKANQPGKPFIGNGEPIVSALAVQVLYHHVFPGTSALLVLALAPRFDRG